MRQPPTSKAEINERKYSFVVEIAVEDDGLEVEVSRQIIAFHKARRVEPHQGRTIVRNEQLYFRWCFSDLDTARAFIEQFGGAFYKTTGA